jgi:S-adenosylmethionine synthetase
LAKRCCIQLSYAIGVARPLSIYCDTYETGTVPSEEIEAAINKCMDLTPRGIRTHLGLNKPIYERRQPTATLAELPRVMEVLAGKKLT